MGVNYSTIKLIYMLNTCMRIELNSTYGKGKRFDNYIENKILDLERIVREKTEELNYYKAVAYLDELAKTAEVKLTGFLSVKHGISKSFIFQSGIQTDSTRWGHCSTMIKLGISDYKKLSGEKNPPAWATAAKKAAKVVDEYNYNYQNNKY